MVSGLDDFCNFFTIFDCVRMEYMYIFMTRFPCSDSDGLAFLRITMDSVRQWGVDFMEISLSCDGADTFGQIPRWLVIFASNTVNKRFGDDTEINCFLRFCFENSCMSPLGLVTPRLTRYNLKHDSCPSDPVSHCVDVTVQL